MKETGIRNTGDDGVAMWSRIRHQRKEHLWRLAAKAQLHEEAMARYAARRAAEMQAQQEAEARRTAEDALQAALAELLRLREQE